MTFPILINVLVYELFADVFIDYTCFSGERFGPWISWWFFFHFVTIGIFLLYVYLGRGY